MLEIVVAILQRTLVMSTPLLLGTIGEIIAERSGVLNLGVEGMMALGAVAGFMAGTAAGSPWAGLAASILVGAAAALVHAWLSVSLRANQTVSGLALSMLGAGIASLAGKPYIGKPIAVHFDPIKLPLLGDLPYFGGIFFSQDIFFYLAVLLGLGSWFVLRYTRVGIKVRSCGENPRAAESQGVDVYAVRYACVAIGGGFSGLAGAFLSLSYSSSWIDGMVAGRGWIVIALTIFALWNPLRAFFGAFLFGGVFVLQYLLQPLGVSSNLLAALPYLATLAVLVAGGLSRDRRHLLAPAQLGELFKRGER